MPDKKKERENNKRVTVCNAINSVDVYVDAREEVESVN